MGPCRILLLYEGLVVFALRNLTYIDLIKPLSHPLSSSSTSSSRSPDPPAENLENSFKFRILSSALKSIKVVLTCTGGCLQAAGGFRSDTRILRQAGLCVRDNNVNTRFCTQAMTAGWPLCEGQQCQHKVLYTGYDGRLASV